MIASNRDLAMEIIHHQIVENIRTLMARILEPKLDLYEFLSSVARAAKQLGPEELEARVYEVDFIENNLYIRTSTQVDVSKIPESERTIAIRPNTITGDAIIENRVILASRRDGYARSRFKEGEEMRAAFPIEFYEVENLEGRTKYVLVVDKKGDSILGPEILAALKDYSILAGLAISIKELRDELSRYYDSNRNLVLTGRHSASIGHDIRSLNVGVGGYLTVAMRYLQGDPGEELRKKALKYMDLALDNSRQVEVLLKNFAEFNRASIVLNRDTDLLDAVADKIESLANRIDFGRFLKFDMSLPEEKTGFLVDRDWFGTVLENLVKNSIEACGGNTRISVRLENGPRRIVLRLEDDCGGISPELLPDIFKPFRSDKKIGQGLGLANIKKVVNDHGGTIKASNMPGLGVVFTIEFNRMCSG